MVFTNQKKIKKYEKFVAVLNYLFGEGIGIQITRKANASLLGKQVRDIKHNLHKICVPLRASKYLIDSHILHVYVPPVHLHHHHHLMGFVLLSIPL